MTESLSEEIHDGAATETVVGAAVEVDFADPAPALDTVAAMEILATRVAKPMSIPVPNPLVPNPLAAAPGVSGVGRTSRCRVPWLASSVRLVSAPLDVDAAIAPGLFLAE